MRYAVAVLLLVALFGEPGVAQNSQSPPPTTKVEGTQELIEEALARNPEIAVSLHNMDAARFRIPQAGALADPELIFKLMEIPGTQFNRAMYANVELAQMVPFPTKIVARQSIAELLATHAHHEHMEKVFSVLAELKTDVALLRFARESMLINKSNEVLLKRILKSAETSYSVGRSSQQELLKINIELAKVSIAEAANQERIVSAESKLRAVLNRPATVPIGALPPENNPVSIPQVDQLLGFSRENRPMLIHDSLNVVEKELVVGLMKKEYIPDLRFSVEYVRMPVLMENRWSVSAGITLPFAPWTLSKTSARVQEAEAEQRMLSAAFSSSKNMIESQIRSEYASLQAISKEIHSYQNVILPQLNQSIELLLSEYETGKSSYLMLIDGYRTYNDAKLEIATARLNYEQALSALEREVGVSDIQSLSSLQKEKQP
jgi:outer membrane protein TolC